MMATTTSDPQEKLKELMVRNALLNVFEYRQISDGLQPFDSNFLTTQSQTHSLTA